MSDKRAVVFVDVVDSTATYETIGDRHAKDLVEAQLDAVRREVAELGGVVVKSLGDGLLCCFRTAEEAACLAFGQGGVRRNWSGLCVGMHYGPVIEEGGDVFGDTVNVAARLVAAAKPSEVLASESIVRRLPGPEWKDRFLEIPAIPVKGKKDPVQIFRMGRTTGRPSLLLDLNAKLSDLALLYGSHTFSLGRDRPSLSLGRSEDNDLVIANPMISEHHARIEARAGNFYIHDTSTNGTLLIWGPNKPESLPAIWDLPSHYRMILYREETRLPACGSIYVGVNEHTYSLPTFSTLEPVVWAVRNSLQAKELARKAKGMLHVAKIEDQRGNSSFSDSLRNTALNQLRLLGADEGNDE